MKILLQLTLFWALFLPFSAYAEIAELQVHTQAGPAGFTVEIADTPEKQQSGLMHRRTMGRDHGMLFIFAEPMAAIMWMKDTPLSLDMLFVDEGNRIVQIARNTTPFSEALIPAGQPVKYVIELRAGAADENHIAVGDEITYAVR